MHILVAIIDWRSFFDNSFRIADTFQISKKFIHIKFVDLKSIFGDETFPNLNFMIVLLSMVDWRSKNFFDESFTIVDNMCSLLNNI